MWSREDVAGEKNAREREGGGFGSGSGTLVLDRDIFITKPAELNEDFSVPCGDAVPLILRGTGSMNRRGPRSSLFNIMRRLVARYSKL